MKTTKLFLILIGLFALMQSSYSLDFILKTKNNSSFTEAQKASLTPSIRDELNFFLANQNDESVVKKYIQDATGFTVIKNYNVFDNYWRVFVTKKGNQTEEPTFAVVSQSLKMKVWVDSLEESKTNFKMANPLQNKQWYLQKPTLSITGRVGNYGSNFEKVWNKATGQNVIVAVIDTGVINHEDIGTITPNVTGAYISSGYDFISDCRVSGSCSTNVVNPIEYLRSPRPVALDTGDFITAEEVSTATRFKDCPVESQSSWHGTFISGMIAGLNNNIGVIGAAYNAKILPIRIGGKCGSANNFDSLDAFLWAGGLLNSRSGITPNPYPAHVINYSFGNSVACTSFENEVIKRLVDRGIIFVTSAGNENSTTIGSPANCASAITVGAVTRSGDKASYSNYNAEKTEEIEEENQEDNGVKKNDEALDISAGAGTITEDLITSTTAVEKTFYNNSLGTYGTGTGTSYTAPQVAASIALLKELNPSISQATALNILKRTAVAFPNIKDRFNCGGGICGAGILNTDLAVSSYKYGILPQSGTAQMPTAGPALEFFFENIATGVNQIVKIETDNSDIGINNIDCIGRVLNGGSSSNTNRLCSISVINKTPGVQKSGAIKVWTSATTIEPQLEIPVSVGTQAELLPVVTDPTLGNKNGVACKKVNNASIPFPFCDSGLTLIDTILPTNADGTPKESSGGCSLIQSETQHKEIDWSLIGLLMMAGIYKLKRSKAKITKI